MRVTANGERCGHMTSNLDRDCGRHRVQTAMALDSDVGRAAADDAIAFTGSHPVADVIGGPLIPEIRVHFGTDGQPIGPLPPKVTWDSSLREITLDSDEDGTIIVDDDNSAYITVNRHGRGAGNAERHGAGGGHATKTGGDGHAKRSGAGIGDARHRGSGEGHAIREGAGDGNAIRAGDGFGFALRTGDGNGNAERIEDGDGDAHRLGAGDGNAICAGRGDGSAWRQDSGSGNASRLGPGEGQAHRHGSGSGKSERDLSETVKAVTNKDTGWSGTVETDPFTGTTWTCTMLCGNCDTEIVGQSSVSEMASDDDRAVNWSEHMRTEHPEDHDG